MYEEQLRTSINLPAAATNYNICPSLRQIRSAMDISTNGKRRVGWYAYEAVIEAKGLPFRLLCNSSFRLMYCSHPRSRRLGTIRLVRDVSVRNVRVVKGVERGGLTGASAK